MQVSLFLILTQCFLNTTIQQKQLTWLAGSWVIETPRGKLIESWQVESDSLLTGKSEFLRPDSDAKLQETLRLERRNHDWYYVSKVEGQNEDRPITFRVTFIGSDEFICENPEHDFPQRIAYRRIENRLFASIEGLENGKLRKRNFDFTRNLDSR